MKLLKQIITWYHLRYTTQPDGMDVLKLLFEKNFYPHIEHEHIIIELLHSEQYANQKDYRIFILPFAERRIDYKMVHLICALESLSFENTEIGVIIYQIK